MSLRDGRVVYARDAQRSFFPASNMKLLTTAVALDLLGTDYRWRTSVFAETGPDADGAIVGDIFLYGRGAPDLNEDSLVQLAKRLYERGVRQVRGDVVGDESFFSGDQLGAGWLWNDIQWYFGAEVSALTVNANESKLIITPASSVNQPANVKVVPENSFASINEAVTVENDKLTAIGIKRGLSDNVVRVWGEVPLKSSGLSARLSVHRPAMWAENLFLKKLKENGINVKGKIRTIDAQDRQAGKGFDLQKAVEIAFVESQPLSEIVRKTNKESWNLGAELLLRTIGKQFGDTAPDSDPKKMKIRGDDEAGVAVLKKWLDEKGIPTSGLSLYDGSGLSRLNLVTPEAFARLLVFMNKHPHSKVFKDSLPIAGQDGTLSVRFRNSAAKGRVFAKTGTLQHISALSGYVIAVSGDFFAFSIICNDETLTEDSNATLDSITSLLATQ
jgi:D-alanyl-D-alanine carboxypeptidase/D-alanyl-D-alanine-endopeptidase (penicillin-binding protein 4)